MIVRRRIASAVLVMIGLLYFNVALAEQEIPHLSRRVTDLTGTLNSQQEAKLEQALAAFEQEKGSQIAVLLVPTTEPETIEQYAIRVAEQWKLGREDVDDGVLMLIAKNDRAARIEVGYGLEGAIPDVMAKRIIEDVMIPYFRQGDFAGGINAGIDSLISLIKGEQLPEPTLQADEELIVIVSGFILSVAFLTSLIFRFIFGKFVGGLINTGWVCISVWYVGGGLIAILLSGMLAYLMAQFEEDNSRGGFGGDSDSGWVGGGFSSGGGGFSGRGGGFGGGGASGSW